MNIKGGLPLLILHLLAEQPGHGYQIASEIKRRSEGVLDFAEGTLYPMLHSLEGQGLIEAYESQEKGRTRRCYRLTDAGRKSLASERAEWATYTGAMNLILGDVS